MPGINKTHLPSLTLLADREEEWFEFTDNDGVVYHKKLLKVVDAVDDNPRVVVFEDNSFTVGDSPQVWTKSANEEATWQLQFSFVSIKTHHPLHVTSGIDDKKVGELMQWLNQTSGETQSHTEIEKNKK